MNKMQAFPWDHPRFRSWISVARACQLMQQALTRALAPLDIKPPHLDILVNLYRFEGISQQGAGILTIGFPAARHIRRSTLFR